MLNQFIPTLTDVRHWLLFVGWLTVAGGALLLVYAIVGQLQVWAQMWCRRRVRREVREWYRHLDQCALAEQRRRALMADAERVAVDQLRQRQHLDTLVVFPGRRTH